MAFDYFRKCPMEDAVMDNLYNLALDFERKRQFTRRNRVPPHGGLQPEVQGPGTAPDTAKQLSET